MAYMNQERKKEIAPAVKAVLKKYSIKGSLAVQNHSTLVLNIKSGKIDFINNSNQVCSPTGNRSACPGRELEPNRGYMDVNTYHYRNHFSGLALACITELMGLMNTGNWDKSDIQADYFDVGWYVDIKVGRYNQHYKLTK